MEVLRRGGRRERRGAKNGGGVTKALRRAGRRQGRDVGKHEVGVLSIGGRQGRGVGKREVGV
jgi:hypothetical protein